MSATEIVPDSKDWTWVLSRPCPDCGLTAADLDTAEIGDRLRAAAAAMADRLAAQDAAVRPSPAVWSPLEYACHVRDVFRLFLTRLELMLAEDDPLFANWDQDATAVTERYDAQDPAEVAAEVRAAVEPLAARFDGLSGDAWDRPGRRSDGAAFTVTTFAQYLVHDPVHHVWDVTPRP